MSQQLIHEAQALHDKARATLEELPPFEYEPPKPKTQNTKRKVKLVSTEVTPQAAAKLYIDGKPVVEVAKELGITYGKARRLIGESGTSIRDASARLKGRTRPKMSAQ